LGLIALVVAWYGLRLVRTQAQLRDYVQRHAIAQCPNGHATLDWRAVQPIDSDWYRVGAFAAISPLQPRNFDLDEVSPAYYLECRTCGFAYNPARRLWELSSHRAADFPHGFFRPFDTDALTTLGGRGYTMECTNETSYMQALDLEWRIPEDGWGAVLRSFQDWITSKQITRVEFTESMPRASVTVVNSYHQIHLDLVHRPATSEIALTAEIVYPGDAPWLYADEASAADYPTYYAVHPLYRPWRAIRHWAGRIGQPIGDFAARVLRL
jgi:hypothetical protein